MERAFTRVAGVQYRRYRLILLATLLITLVLGSGLTRISLETDFRKGLPQDIPVFQMGDKISAKFGGEDSILILARLDPAEDARGAPRDIRDPRVLASLAELESLLRREAAINRVSSVASLLPRAPATLEESKALLAAAPGAGQFFNPDFSATLLFATSSLGGGQAKVQEASDLIQRRVAEVPRPPGLQFTVTGTPVLQNLMFGLLISDTLFTLSLTAVLIYVFLWVTHRSPTRAALLFVPLGLGVAWTFGAMGWLGIPLSFGTVFLAPLLIGLGCEYGAFLLSRYHEARAAGAGQEDALRTALGNVGAAQFGSASTTVAGFGVLMTASMPVIQQLGATTALGIGLTFLASVFINPAVILAEENFAARRRGRAAP